jgi:ParB family chromosome partitioning protein
MAKTHPKITLRPSRDIPLDKLVLSQANVRRIKNGVTIEHLADSIARRRLLGSHAPIKAGKYRIPAHLSPSVGVADGTDGFGIAYQSDPRTVV